MTDHKRIAGDALDSLGEWFSREGMTDATMVSSSIAAQASATLYLAEQQRIANLIAFLAICEERGAADEKYRELDRRVINDLGLA